jgi:altronate hydrolase
MTGYLRSDGRKGIRNHILVAYLVECAHHVAREIQLPYRDRGVQLIGFPGCAPNAYALNMMKRLCTHPNVGGVLLVSLGCENMDKQAIFEAVKSTGRPVEMITIQEAGGTAASIEQGSRWVEAVLPEIQHMETVDMTWEELCVGTICGGSDATSGLTANPAIGVAFDQLMSVGSTAIFEETGELIGCGEIMASRAARPELAHLLRASVDKAERYYRAMGLGSFSVGNAEGGITTIEEKSMGAYSKSGSASIAGIIKPGDVPPAGGLYLLDVVPDGPPQFGWPNINDNAEIVELIACGAHIILFSTGRGSVVGSAISPVIKVCANPETYRRMPGDMDVNAGRILNGEGTLEEVGGEIFSLIAEVCTGRPTASEALHHQEFVLTYKRFEGLEPGCLPAG